MACKYSLIFIGCGQIGSRHLQAASCLKEISEIHIIDQSEEALNLAKLRLKEVPDLNKSIKFFWHDNLSAAACQKDLCVVSTQAQQRKELLRKLIEDYDCKKLLIEKIVVQSVKDYQELLEITQKNKTFVWVNCKTRTYSIHKYIKSLLNPQEPIYFSDSGGNLGLANNGVHSTDLFVFFDGANKITGFGSEIKPVLIPSKRGKNNFDLSGTLCGITKKGSKFILSFMDNSTQPNLIYVGNSKIRFLVDHFKKFAYESSLKEDWKWKSIPIEEDWNISSMSKCFIANILIKNSCELPTLKECFPSHEFILGELLPHFNHLLNKETEYCPVT